MISSKKCLLIGMMGLLLGVMQTAYANENLARQKNCFSCHSVSKRIVGPAFKDVAKKYAGDSTVAEKLEQHVLHGSTGVWGMIPMPANTQVSKEEAHQLVQWVLQQK